MALKTKMVRFGPEALRDAGKTFLLTEMAAEQAEKWAIRVFLGMGKSGVNIPPDILEFGMVGIYMMGFKSLLTMAWADAEPLLDELMACIRTVPDPRHLEMSREFINADTEEMSTRFKLRSEVFELHTGFSVAGLLSRLTSRVLPADPDENTSNTPTSDTPSEQ